MTIPFTFLINLIVAKFTDASLVDIWDIVNYGTLLMATIAIFYIGNHLDKRVI